MIKPIVLNINSEDAHSALTDGLSGCPRGDSWVEGAFRQTPCCARHVI